MNLGESLSLARDYATGYGQHCVAFFEPRAKRVSAEGGAESSDNVAVYALFSLLIGVTLQDRFMSLKAYAEINFIDRSVGQIVFWFTMCLVTHFCLRVGAAERPMRVSFMAILTVFPISFVVASYVATLVHFAGFVVRLYGGYWSAYFLVWAFMLAQTLMLMLYLPRELERHGERRPRSRLAAAVVVVCIVIMIDLLVAYGPMLSAPIKGAR